MEIHYKKGLIPKLLLVLFLLLATVEAVDFWQDESDAYNKLEDAQFVLDLTANDLTQRRKVGVLLFGDGGMGNQAQYDVASGMWNLCREKTCALAIGLGDNIYPAGVTSISDPLWKSNFESPYEKFIEAADRDFWMAIGNHDRRGSIDAQLRYSQQSPIWKMPARDYAIPNLPRWLNIYVLDTTFIAPGADVPSFQRAFEKNFQAQLERASAHLCKKAGWRVIATHHPLVSNGGRNNRFREDNVYNALHPFIEECGINLVFSGHEHLQQHVQMDGVDYLIQGAASVIRQRAKPLQHSSALSRYLGYQLGFGHLVFTKDKVDIRFSGRNGKSLYVNTIQFAYKKKRQNQAAKLFL